jgi:hypothetical protein
LDRNDCDAVITARPKTSMSQADSESNIAEINKKKVSKLNINGKSVKSNKSNKNKQLKD